MIKISRASVAWNAEQRAKASRVAGAREALDECVASGFCCGTAPGAQQRFDRDHFSLLGQSTARIGSRMLLSDGQCFPRAPERSAEWARSSIAISLSTMGAVLGAATAGGSSFNASNWVTGTPSSSLPDDTGFATDHARCVS